jgi:hypothetical protein
LATLLMKPKVHTLICCFKFKIGINMLTLIYRRDNIIKGHVEILDSIHVIMNDFTKFTLLRLDNSYKHKLLV